MKKKSAFVKRTLSMLCIATVLIVMSGCIAVPESKTWMELSGKVYNPKADEPWVGGKLVFVPKNGGPAIEAVTDEEGFYLIDKIRAGDYQFKFYGPDGVEYRSSNENVRFEVKSGKVRLDFQIPKLAYRFFEAEELDDIQAGPEGEGWSGSSWMGDVEGPLWDRQHMGFWDASRWSNEHQLFLVFALEGNWVEGSFTLPPEASEVEYQVNVGVTTAENYGIVEIKIDDTVIGTIDLWGDWRNDEGPDPKRWVNPKRVENLGTVTLGPGTHTVRMTIVGKGPNFPPHIADGIAAGLDYIEFVQVDDE